MCGGREPGALPGREVGQSPWCCKGRSPGKRKVYRDEYRARRWTDKFTHGQRRGRVLSAEEGREKETRSGASSVFGVAPGEHAARGDQHVAPAGETSNRGLGIGLMGFRYVVQKDGEWVQPKRRAYRLACCDCGLIHRINFRVVKGRIWFQAFRDARATAVRRRRLQRRP